MQMSNRFRQKKFCGWVALFFCPYSKITERLTHRLRVRVFLKPFFDMFNDMRDGLKKRQEIGWAHRISKCEDHMSKLYFIWIDYLSEFGDWIFYRTIGGGA